MKKLLILFTCLVLALSIAACGSKTNNNADNKTTDGDAAKSFKGVTITHLAQASTNRPEAYTEFAKEFEQQTGAKVEIVDSAYEQMHDKIVNDLISKTGSYDVMDIDSGWDADAAPLLEPLQPYIDNNHIDMSAHLDIYQKLVGVGSVTNNQRYGLPITGQAMALFYRPDILKENNLELPKNWDEFDAILPKLQKDGMYPFVTAGVNVQLIKLFFARYIPQGKPLFDRDFNPLFNGPEGAKALEGIKTMFHYAPKGVLSMDNPDANQIFLNGQAAFLITWPNTILADLQDAVKSKVVDKWDVTAPPGPGNLGPWYIGLNKYSKHKDAAFAWMAFITSKEKSKELMMKYGNYPTQKAVWEDSDVNASVPGAKGVGVAISKSMWFTLTAHPLLGPWWSKLGEETSKVLTDQTSAQNAVDAVAKFWNEESKNSKPPAGAIYEEVYEK